MTTGEHELWSGLPFYFRLTATTAHELAAALESYAKDHCGGRITASAEQGAGGGGEYTGVRMFVKIEGDPGFVGRRLHVVPGDLVAVTSEGRLLVIYGGRVG